MRFNVVVGNHYDASLPFPVDDISTYLRNALLSAGHDAYLVEAPLARGVNVVIETFWPDFLQNLIELSNSGTPYIIFATEFIVNGGFNRHLNPADGLSNSHYSVNAYWDARYWNFSKAAQSAQAIWCASEQLVEQYRAALPGLTIDLMPWGFDPLFTDAPNHNGPKDFDVMFTGSITEHRCTILTNLAERFSVGYPVRGTASGLIRRDMIARSRIALHLGLVSQAIYTSPARHHVALMSGQAMHSEASEVPGDLDEFIEIFKISELGDHIDRLITNDRWRRQGEDMRDLYRRTRPLRPAMEALLDFSFG